MGLGSTGAKDAHAAEKVPALEDAAPYLCGKPLLSLHKNSRVAGIDHHRASSGPVFRERKKPLPHGTDFAFPY
jgi:hypothetical protein